MSKDKAIEIMAIKDLVWQLRPVVEILTAIRAYAAAGGTKEELLSAMQALRDVASDEQEDLLLEVMDVAVGFVSPGMAVW